jgi:glycosyltransferase involved in cell wall biosynthesis
MRVAHVITRLIVGGAQENTLFNVVDQQRLFGDDVCLISGPGLGPEGSLEPVAREQGVNLKILPELRRSLHPLQDLRSLRAIGRALDEFQPELVHTHSSKAGILGRLSAAERKLAAVHTIHGAAFHFGQRAIARAAYKLAERRAARWCDHFISVSEAMTKQYLAAGIGRPGQFTTIYSGMDVDRFLTPAREPAAVRGELKLQPTDIVFCKVARLFHLKGHAALINAARRVAAEIPNARFVLVGDGILRAEFEQRIGSLGLTDRFRFAGLVRPEAVSDYLHAADVVVHTSDWEGLPRVLPQALIAGKPVISFDNDGAPEVCLPEVTGLLVPYGDIVALESAMIRLAREPALRTRLGHTGRERFAGVFRHEHMTARIREVYQQVLSQRS